MSTYQDELMDTDEMDDAESKYFQEVINYDDTADQSSGSFQGSLIVPTFNLESDSFQGNEFQQTMEQSGVKVELSALALQRSQGFQTLDQSTEGQGHCWQTVDTGSEQMIHMLTGGQLTGLGPLSSNSNIQLKLEKSEHTGLETNTGQQDHNNGITVDSASDLFYSNSASASSSGTKRMDMPSNAGLHGSSTFPQTVSKADEVDTISMASTSSGTDGPSLENRSPKRRQKKSKSTAQQGSELLTQKSEPGRPSLSPNRGEHGSSEGQGSTELGFKPSLLEEILTEKKLALLRSPEVIQFLQSQQDQRCKEKNIVYSQPPEKT